MQRAHDDLDTFSALTLAISAAAATIAASTISAQIYLSMPTHGHSAARIFLWQFGSWMFWALLAPFVLGLGGRLPGGLKRLPRHLPRLGGAWATAVIGHVVIAAQLSVWCQPFYPLPPTPFEEALLAGLGVMLVHDSFVFSALLLVGHTLAVHRRTRRIELRDSQLETELARAHLEALRLDIQPHFLFNTLNGIAALIRRGTNEQALDMLLGLSDLMRARLDRANEQVVTVEAEVEFTKRYVDLQRNRFADRLDVEYDIAEPCRELTVPTFVLQPLVENAFQHGIARKSGRCRLEIGARLTDTCLHLWVSDSGVGLPSGFGVHQEGKGLGNTRARLDRLYGASAHLDVRRTATGETVADVFVPAS